MAKLVPVADLQPAFSNAMDHLHRKLMHSHPHETITMGVAANHFKEEFDCYAMWDQAWNWDVVGFKNDEQHLMFVLKWS